MNKIVLLVRSLTAAAWAGCSRSQRGRRNPCTAATCKPDSARDSRLARPSAATVLPALVAPNRRPSPGTYHGSSKGDNMMRKRQIMRSTKLLAALVAASGAVAAAAQAEPGTLSQLTPIGGGNSGGMVEVSPTAHDVAGPGTFNVEGTVNVHGLAPDTGYRFLRWFDFNPDGICTGTTARSLPGNPTLTTSDGGAGALHFELSLGAPFVDGVSFDTVWRVVDLAGNTVLQGDCFTVTVK